MKRDLEENKIERKTKRIYAIAACLVLAVLVTVVPALAADDPLAVVNNLSDFSAPVSGR